MFTFKVLFILAFIECIFCDERSLLRSCRMHDIECLNESTKQFLGRTRGGIPQYNIRPIDPLMIPSLDVVDQDGIVYHFKNINVTGLRDQQISDFQMDTATKSVLLKTKTDLRILGEVVMEMQKESTSFSNVYSAETNLTGEVTYGYELRKDNEGVLHFEVGPETFACDSIDDPKVTLNSVWADAWQKDADFHDSALQENRSLNQRILCKIAELSYVEVVNNIRAAAQVLPATAFFEDL